MQDCNVIFKFLEKNCTLLQLNLSVSSLLSPLSLPFPLVIRYYQHNNLEDEGIKDLGRHLSLNQTLEELDISVAFFFRFPP